MFVLCKYMHSYLCMYTLYVVLLNPVLLLSASFEFNRRHPLQSTNQSNPDQTSPVPDIPNRRVVYVKFAYKFELLQIPRISRSAAQFGWLVGWLVLLLLLFMDTDYRFSD